VSTICAAANFQRLNLPRSLGLGACHILHDQTIMPSSRR
jgi:hypothetical protein